MDVKKLLFTVINKLRTGFGKIVDFFFKMGKTKDGKFGSPKKIRKWLLPAILIGISLAFIIRIVMEKDSGGARSRYESEIQIEYNRGGVAAVASVTDDEQLKLSMQGEDKYEGYSNLSGIAAKLANIPSADRCQELLNRASGGTTLNPQEKGELDSCLKNNVLGLSQEQIKALETLMDPNADLTDAERALLQKFVKGELKNADDIELARALMSDDPFKRKIARTIINNPNMSEEEKKRLIALLKKKELTPEDIAEIESILDNYPEKGIEGDVLKSEKGADDSDINRLKSLANKIESVDSQIAALEAGLKKDAGRYRSLVEKQLRGEPLTDEELAFIQAYNEKLKKLTELKRKRDELLKEHSALLAKIKEEMIKSALNASKYSEGGYASVKDVLSAEEISEYIKNQKEKEDAQRRRKMKRKTVVKRRKLTPEEMRILGLSSDQDLKEVKLATLSDGEKMPELSAETFYLMQGQKSSKFELPPNLKVAAVTQDSVLASSNLPSDPINIMILEDIVDPYSNKIIISKNSIAVTSLGKFDIDTGYIEGAISQVVDGYKTVDVSLAVRIPGQGRDTRDKILTEAMITEVVNSASQFARNEAMTNLTDAQTLAAAVTAGGMNATSGIMEQIGEFLSQDLKNANEIFFSPKGVKVFLRSN